VRFPGNFGHTIAHQDHSIVVLDPTAHRRGYTNASRYTRDDASVDGLIAEDRIEGRAWREAAKAFLDDQMFAFAGLQLVDDLRSPGILDNECAVAARRTNSNPPIWECRIGIVRFDHVRDIDHRSSG